MKTAVIEMSYGEMIFELFDKEAPKMVATHKTVSTDKLK